jgi:hypothetical protein
MILPLHCPDTGAAHDNQSVILPFAALNKLGSDVIISTTALISDDDDSNNTHTEAYTYIYI